MLLILGAGDDTYTIATVATTGAKIDGGADVDTLAMTSVLAATLSAGTTKKM